MKGLVCVLGLLGLKLAHCGRGEQAKSEGLISAIIFRRVFRQSARVHRHDM